MERGFSNAPQEGCVPQPLPDPKPTPQENPSPRTQIGSEEAVTAKDATDVKTTAFEDLSNARNHDTKGEAERPSRGDGDDNDAKTEPEPPSQDHKDGDKETLVNVHSTPIFAPTTRPFPRSPGWGRDPDEEIFHRIPESHGGTERKRAVFRVWPRVPNCRDVKQREKPWGTQSPDGYPWGATLYDFFIVDKVPTRSDTVFAMTGTGLLELMDVLEEPNIAEAETEWVKSEGQPRVEGVANTGALIESIERKVHLMGYPEDDPDDEDNDNSVPSPPMTIPVTSPFHPNHYPKPWPFTPFENPLSILLQERIPLYLLPQTLYVHDPFKLLRVRGESFYDTSWSSRPDIIRTYKLDVCRFLRKEVEEVRKQAEELEESRARTLIIMRYKRTKEQIENSEPGIEVALPPYPCRMTKVEESHLYISPVAKVGEGNHSDVYKGEWELPRDIFTRPKICQQCFEESVDEEIQRLKDTGRWEMMLRAASLGPTGFTGRRQTQAELDEVRDPINLEKNGEIIEREITFTVLPGTSPSRIFEMVEQGSMCDGLVKQKDVKTLHVDLTGGDPDGSEGESMKSSYAPTIRIDPTFSYESQDACTHGSRCFLIPRTAKFTVIAKLSIEFDEHLAWEAVNYQSFPERFFQHYNGYTIIRRLNTMVPVPAIVPQFYGYYTPEGREEHQRYLSPILLLEHCGDPIDPLDLSVEDLDECASLLHRFHDAGWVHESVASRNFVVQKGKPTEFPEQRELRPELSFRMIDFGRSKRIQRQDELWTEQFIAQMCLFGRSYGKLTNVTFTL